MQPIRTGGKCHAPGDPGLEIDVNTIIPGRCGIRDDWGDIEYRHLHIRVIVIEPAHIQASSILQELTLDACLVSIQVLRLEWRVRGGCGVEPTTAHAPIVRDIRHDLLRDVLIQRYPPRRHPYAIAPFDGNQEIWTKARQRAESLSTKPLDVVRIANACRDAGTGTIAIC